MEADLSRYHGASLVDLDEGRLSLWQVWARLRHLPMESATAQAQGHADGWSLLAYLAADIYQLVAGGQSHPADPRTVRQAEQDREQARRTKERHDQMNTNTTSVFRRRRTT